MTDDRQRREPSGQYDLPGALFDIRRRVGGVDLGLTGREVYENTRPVAWADAETDYSWARFISALSGLLDPIAEITRPEDGSEQWTILGSPWRVPTPWLRVLAQWAGTRVAVADSMTEEELRDLLAHGGPGFWRGTRAGISALIRRFYPEDAPPQFLYVEERADGDPYKVRIFTYANFTPPEVEAQIREALLLNKPAGLSPFIYEVRVGQTYWMLNQRVESYAEMNDHYENYYEVLHDEPLGGPE